jgi:hypothetical protein
VELLLNDGDGGLEALAQGHEEQFSFVANAAAAGDFNGDGRADLVIDGFARGRVLLSDPESPTGFSSGPQTGDIGRAVAVIATGDFNGDGRDDVVLGGRLAYTVDPTIHVFITSAAAAFEDGRVYDAGIQSHDIITGEFTGDGASDLLVVGGPADPRIALLPGLGDGRFGPARRFEAPGLVFAAAADMDGDGSLDVLVGDSQRHVVTVLRNDGAGRFAPGEEMVVPDPWRLGAGDLNGDGRQDIVTAGVSHMHILLSEGAAMAAPRQIALPGSGQGLSLRDMDGDGHSDIVVLIDTSGWLAGALVFINDGAGGFDGPGAFWLGADPRGLVTEDLDGDGDVDLVAVSGAGLGATTSTLRVLESRMADGGCRGDLTGDGTLDFFDFLMFQELFVAGDLAADFSGDGSLDFFDFLAFQEAFAAGCAGR